MWNGGKWWMSGTMRDKRQIERNQRRENGLVLKTIEEREKGSGTKERDGEGIWGERERERAFR